jgi:hypothetical protein
VPGRSPAARYAGTLITDAARGRLLLFGGQGKNARADLWQLVDTAESPADAMDAEPSPSPEASPTSG